jgi:hypothetical protein
MTTPVNEVVADLVSQAWTAGLREAFEERASHHVSSMVA